MHFEGGEKNLQEVEQKAEEDLFFLLSLLNGAKNLGLEYVLLGGFALQAYMGEAASVIRKNGTLRDIDLKIINDPRKAVSLIQHIVKSRKKRGDFLLPVTWGTVRDDNKRYQPLLTNFVREKGGQISLKFRSLKSAPVTDLLKRQKVKLRLKGGKSVEVPSFEAETLLHLYLTRAAFIKLKDKEKIIKFARYISRSTDHAFGEGHSKYRVFHDFVREVRMRYPVYVNSLYILQYVDNCLENRITQKLLPESLINRLFA